MLEQWKATSPVIIIGMHRSGTSMLTRLLHAASLHMGNDLSMNAESKCFQKLNRYLLADTGSDWSDICAAQQAFSQVSIVEQYASVLNTRLFEDGQINAFLGWKNRVKLWMGQDIGSWGWKDPRNSITLPVWRILFPNSKVIHVIRNGIDVAISMHRRQSKYSESDLDYSEAADDFANCVNLWEQYVRASFAYKHSLSASEYLEIRYENILEEPIPTLRSILDFAGHPMSTAQLEKSVRSIQRERLNNAEYRTKYRNEIDDLGSNQLMEELGYQ